MKVTGHQIIGYQIDQNSQASGFFPVNPKNGRSIEEVKFYNATEDQMDRAVRLAAAAHSSYKASSTQNRALFLRSIADEIEKIGEALTAAGHAETGLPEGRLNGERGRTTGQLRMFADWIEEGSYVQAVIDEELPERKPLPRADIRRMNLPLGPVVVFGASNFPLAFSVAGGDTASALAAGCPVIVKAHPAHPTTSELVGLAIRNAAEKTGMPEGVFSLIQGNTNEAGGYLVTHPMVRAVGFTGSFRGGKALYDLAQSRPEPIPVFAEMGSTNPVFILPGALQSRGKEIASGLAGSINLGAGQFCTNPGVFMVQKSDDTDHFTDRIREVFSELESQVMLTPDIHSAYNAGTHRLSQSGRYEVIARGKQENSAHEGRPTLFQIEYSNAREDSQLTHENFGPSSIMVTANTEEEILEFAHSLEGHLTATIHADDSDGSLMARLLPILQEKVGRIIFNAYPTGVEVCHAMVHGGPYPATTFPGTTSVGTAAIFRFLRPVCYQDIPDQYLPDALKKDNPLGIMRLVNGKYVR